MKRYWFELTDERYNDLGAAISDGWQKSPAIAEAKRWMKENVSTTMIYFRPLFPKPLYRQTYMQETTIQVKQSWQPERSMQFFQNLTVLFRESSQSVKN